MPTGLDLVEALRETRKDMIRTVEDMRSTGRRLAEHERSYKVAQHKEAFRLHEEQKVGWSAVLELTHGAAAVADLRFKRDVYRSEYECLTEKLNVLKIEIRVLENEIRAERMGE